MNVKKMYATCLMISFFVWEPMQAKDTREYMEEIFNKKSEGYQNFAAETEYWLSLGKKILVPGAIIGLYGKWQIDKEAESLDYALKKRIFAGKTIRDGGLGIIMLGFGAQAPFWYMMHNLYQEAQQLKQKEEVKHNKKLVHHKRPKN